MKWFKPIHPHGIGPVSRRHPVAARLVGAAALVVILPLLLMGIPAAFLVSCFPIKEVAGDYVDDWVIILSPWIPESGS